MWTWAAAIGQQCLYRSEWWLCAVIARSFASSARIDLCQWSWTICSTVTAVESVGRVVKSRCVCLWWLQDEGGGDAVTRICDCARRIHVSVVCWINWQRPDWQWLLLLSGSLILSHSAALHIDIEVDIEYDTQIPSTVGVNDTWGLGKTTGHLTLTLALVLILTLLTNHTNPNLSYGFQSTRTLNKSYHANSYPSQLVPNTNSYPNHVVPNTNSYPTSLCTLQNVASEKVKVDFINMRKKYMPRMQWQMSKV